MTTLQVQEQGIMRPLSFWAQRGWKVGVRKKGDLNRVEGNGEG